MNMNKKMILFCSVSLLAICVFLTDRGTTTSKEHEKPAQVAEETSQSYVSTGAAVISGVSQTAVQAPDEEPSAGQEHETTGQSKEGGVRDTNTPAAHAATSSQTAQKEEKPGQDKEKASSTQEKKNKSGSTGKTERSPKGKQTEKPAKHADPSASPSDKPHGPEVSADVSVNQCALQITCSSVLSHMDQLKDNIKKIIPPDGVILEGTYEFARGDTVFDVLKKVCSEQNILIDYVFTPGFSTYYIKGINQLYEFDCGDESGWMYSVNGKDPDIGCSQYKVKKNDNIVFYYTCER